MLIMLLWFVHVYAMTYFYSLSGNLYFTPIPKVMLLKRFSKLSNGKKGEKIPNVLNKYLLAWFMVIFKMKINITLKKSIVSYIIFVFKLFCIYCSLPEVGPCALDYTKMKTTDHFWTDPPADELVQRHRIHSSTNHITGPGSPKRPGLQVCLVYYIQYIAHSWANSCSIYECVNWKLNKSVLYRQFSFKNRTVSLMHEVLIRVSTKCLL